MMKKTIFILTALAALACTAISCRKEFAEMRPGATGFTVTATIAGGGTGSAEGTKVLAEDTGEALKLKWEQGDKLIGFDNATPRNTYGFEVTSVDGGKATLTRIEDGTSAEKGTATTDPADGTTMYMLYVPGKTVVDLGPNFNPSESILSYDLSTQAVDALPVSMTAQGTVTDGKLDLTFKVQTAIIGIKSPTMAASGTTYSSITMTTTPDKTINNQVKFYLEAGDLKAGYEQATVEAVPVTSITKNVSFTSDDSMKGPDVIYLVACPIENADLTFTSDKGEAFTKTGKTVAAGKYYHMSPTFESSAREITVTFGSATSALFGGSLSFDVTKKIKVSNETESEDCDITVTGSTATITTNLEGPLTAVYPSTAAKMNSTDANKIDGVQISATQDGTIAGALATIATVTGTNKTAEFNNQTAVFKITLPKLTTNAKSLKVKSLPPATSASRSGDKVAINTAGADDDAKSVITVSPTSGTITSESTIYVSLAPGVKLCDLAFDAITGTHTGSMAGIPGSGSSAATAKNTLNAVAGANFHEYVQIGDYKYATMNIGANSPGETGLYFAWAEVSGHPYNGTAFDFTGFDHSDARYSSSFKEDSGFTSSYAYNAPYSNCKKTVSYYKSATSGNILELMDDAAYVNWGGPWSMSEFKVPISTMAPLNLKTPINLLVYGGDTVVKRFWQDESSSYGAKGVLFQNAEKTDAVIFLPATGYGGGKAKNSDSNLYYWSTTSAGGKNANNVLYSGSASLSSTTAQERYKGCPIRPVSIY